LIYLSSGSIFSSNNLIPNPNNYYGLSKFVAEKLIQIKSNKFKKKEHIIIRFPIVVGINSRSNIVDDFAKKMVNNQKIEIYGDGKIKRNITHIDDVLLFFDKIFKKKRFSKNLEFFNFGSKNSLYIRDIANLIKKTLNSKSKIVNINKSRNSNYNAVIKKSSFNNLLNFKPISTKESIIRLINQKYL